MSWRHCCSLSLTALTVMAAKHYSQSAVAGTDFDDTDDECVNCLQLNWDLMQFAPICAVIGLYFVFQPNAFPVSTIADIMKRERCTCNCGNKLRVEFALPDSTSSERKRYVFGYQSNGSSNIWPGTYLLATSKSTLSFWQMRWLLD